MKKIIVEESNCIGCGACVGTDSEHFDFNNDGLSFVKSQNNLDSESLQEAIACCPVNAISIGDDANSNNQNCDHECHCDNCDCDNCDCDNCDCDNCDCDNCDCDSCQK